MNHAGTILASLSDAALAALATAGEARWLTGGSSNSAFACIAGDDGAGIATWLKSLEDASFTPSQTARLHAKIVVVDRSRLFLTSANLRANL